MNKIPSFTINHNKLLRGITMACGTGACATAVAAALTGRASRRSEIRMDGGTLQIEWRSADNHVYMTGPAEIVFDGEIGE